MTPLMLASNYLWVPICLLALVMITWDWRYSKQGRFLIALALALVLGSAGVYAAEISWDLCNVQCPILPAVLWYLTGCFLC